MKIIIWNMRLKSYDLLEIVCGDTNEGFDWAIQSTEPFIRSRGLCPHKPPVGTRYKSYTTWADYIQNEYQSGFKKI